MLPCSPQGGKRLSTLVEIAKNRWEWRRRILQLALFEMRNEGRGAALSWGWFFIRPLAYILCFWFAIGLGLRGGEVDPGQPPYVLWLSAGIVPWMFMRGILDKGIRAFSAKSNIVTAMKMPLACITSIFAASLMLVQLMLVAMLLVIYFACGQAPSIHLLQVPVLLVLMLVFWDMVALMLSIVSAISKDFSQLFRVLATPLFWISGVIFNVDKFPVAWVQPLFDLNPICFFVKGFRCAFYSKTWIFADAGACIGFAVAAVLTAGAAAWLQKRFGRMVPDLV